MCILIPVYHSVQLRHTWSDISRLLRVRYRKLEFCVTSFWFYSRHSWHAVLVLFLLYIFLVWILSWRNLFQVTGTDTSWVLYITCSQLITFVEFTLYSAYCSWFAALFASPYAVLLRSCPYLCLIQFDSSVYIRIQFELHSTVQS